MFVRPASMDEGRRLQRISRTAKVPVRQWRAIVGMMSAQGQAVRDIVSLMQVSEDCVRDVSDPVVGALIRYVVGDTCADWLDVPRTAWDTAIKDAPALLGMLEKTEDHSLPGAWALDRLGHFTTLLELSSLTRGRIMHYAIPEQLKKDFGVTSATPRTNRWTPPAPSVTT
ncbi:hypothetical protein FNJ62_06025 [Streptomyces benahoarensis]|uniref:Uncharacterized protein n=1 Tax=Streptomyces benahoarensis TaxID=2595054 RepID=A0A553Z9M3_9ACTN|nr:hypothetical protein FNJ62_06025 [Streptomyces benahoarensis]TSB38130.1 hypothetical protein FNZ23_17575 [Streptomyces benahoarensis]